MWRARTGALSADSLLNYLAENGVRLIRAIDHTKQLLGGLRVFNKDEWVVRYPQLREPTESTPLPDETSPISPPRPEKSMRRSLSFADDPSVETDVVLNTSIKGPRRALTLTSLSELQEEHAGDAEDAAKASSLSDFSVLRLDLKLGSHSSSSAASLVSQLEKASIANLLDERIGSSINHIEKLRNRVEDASSKVLVTGDLNAGKSTFVNALLRREIMPVDQQPCTTAFCEVHDAAENNGKEEVHIVKLDTIYDLNDASTYDTASISDLDQIVADNEDSQPMIKLYLADTRAPTESLLNNGVVDISLIDAPGLNRDSLQTTAVFARQEEIDVVVFVVSAENHFTLSAKEFLQNASAEKAYVFIVVNKYDQIKNKEKCRRLVLDQIKQLSPRTYDDSENLVHFVDSATALNPSAFNPSFDELEQALRSFVLVKRSRSKLQPVSTYLSNLLSDIEFLASANGIVAETEILNAREDLAHTRPVLEMLKGGRNALDNALENVEEDGASTSSSRTKVVLNNALDRVSQGQLGVEKPLVPMPSYPGLLGIWDYARDVRRALLASLDAAVILAENEARVIASAGVQKIKDLGDVHLPDGVERSRRVFMPEAMFSTVRRSNRGARSRRASGSYSHIGGAIVAGGLHGLGIGLAQRPDMLETTFFDVFDVNHQFFLHFGDGKIPEEEGASPGVLGIVSVGVGALTMVGGQAIGARAVLEGIIRVTDLLGNETARKWAAPVLGAVTIGLATYLVLELPSSIPRTVGRRIKTSVASGSSEDIHFVEFNANRISRETRKVLKLASWDLREKFRSALEDTSKEVRLSEEKEKKGLRAKDYFAGVVEKTAAVREEARLEMIGA